MRIPLLALLVCAISLLSLAEPARAQSQQSAAQKPAPALRMGRYDKSTEVVTSGSIASIQTQKTGALPRGTYLTVHSGTLKLNVHMGLFSPSAIPFAVGDQVQITGSLISMNGNQVLLARQVQSSSQSLTVRSSNGFVMRPHAINPTQTFTQRLPQ